MLFHDSIVKTSICFGFRREGELPGPLAEIVVLRSWLSISVGADEDLEGKLRPSLNPDSKIRKENGRNGEEETGHKLPVKGIGITIAWFD